MVLTTLLKSDLFKRIRFPVGRKSEDWFIMYKLFDFSRGIVFSQKRYYHYRQRIGSITTSVNMDIIDAALGVEKFIKRRHPEMILKAYASTVIAVIYAYDQILLSGGYSKLRREVLKCRKILADR